MKLVPEPANVLVEQAKVFVNAKAEALNVCTASLKVNANVAPVLLLLALKYMFASLAQVSTGATTSGIVRFIEAEVVA